jgi:hypothetical protein
VIVRAERESDFPEISPSSRRRSAMSRLAARRRRFARCRILPDLALVAEERARSSAT